MRTNQIDPDALDDGDSVDVSAEDAYRERDRTLRRGAINQQSADDRGLLRDRAARRGARILAFATAVTLGGCAHWTPESRVEEYTYQVLGAADMAETLQGLRYPVCYSETNTIVGPHPTPATTVGYTIGRGVLHFAITDVLEQLDADVWIKRVWQASGLYVEGHAVYANFRLGAKPWGAACPAR